MAYLIIWNKYSNLCLDKQVETTQLKYYFLDTCNFCLGKFHRLYKHSCNGRIPQQYLNISESDIVTLNKPEESEEIKQIIHMLPFQNKVQLCQGCAYFAHFLAKSVYFYAPV